jgi:anti-sigma factor ChrR (cupin superfamily)
MTTSNPKPIGERDAPTPGQTHVVRTEDLPWQDLGPGIRCKVLYRDEANESATVLFHFAPGSQAPAHEHMGVEQTYIIEGSLSDHDGTMTAGQLAVRDAGSVHAAYTETGSLHIAFFSKPVRDLKGGIAGFFKAPPA